MKTLSGGILSMDRDSLAWDSLSRKLWCIKNLQKFEKVKKTRQKILQICSKTCLEIVPTIVRKIVPKLSPILSIKLSGKLSQKSGIFFIRSGNFDVFLPFCKFFGNFRRFLAKWVLSILHLFHFFYSFS